MPDRLEEQQLSLFDTPTDILQDSLREEELKSDELNGELLENTRSEKAQELLDRVKVSDKSLEFTAQELPEVLEEFPKIAPEIMEAEKIISPEDVDKMSQEELIEAIDDLIGSDEISDKAESLLQQGIDLKEYYKDLVCVEEYDNLLEEDEKKIKLPSDFDPVDIISNFNVSKKIYGSDVDYYNTPGMEITPYFPKAAKVDENGEKIKDAAGRKVMEYIDEPYWPEWYIEGATCYDSMGNAFKNIEDAYNTEVLFAKDQLSQNLWKNAVVTQLEEKYRAEHDGKLDAKGFNQFVRQYQKDNDVELQYSNMDARFNEIEKAKIVAGLKEELAEERRAWKEEKAKAKKEGVEFTDPDPTLGLTWLDRLCEHSIKIGSFASDNKELEGSVYFFDLTDLDEVSEYLRRKYLD